MKDLEPNILNDYEHRIARIIEHYGDEEKFPRMEQYGIVREELDSFLSWLSEQPYYENTTVVIVGDHPTMDTKYITSLAYAKDSYERKAYCAILNSAVSYELPYARQFTSMDMYPTTLAAMGFKISGDRLGIGVNLFSNEPTMLEKYGKKKLDQRENTTDRKQERKRIDSGNKRI